MASIFTKILQGEIPSEILYETKTVFAIRDINPEEKTHLLIIPKEEIASINDLDTENIDIMKDMLLLAKKIVIELWIENAYKLRINAWEYQEVPHIHMHLLSKY